MRFKLRSNVCKWPRVCKNPKCDSRTFDSFRFSKENVSELHVGTPKTHRRSTQNQPTGVFTHPRPLAAFRRVVQRIGQGFEGQPFRRNGTSVNNASNAPLLPFQLHLSQLLGEGHSARPSFNSAAPSGCMGELNFDVVAVLCPRRAMSHGSL